MTPRLGFRISALFFIAITCLLACCAPESNSASTLATSTSTSNLNRPDQKPNSDNSFSYSFGPMIGSTEPLIHTFSLYNPDPSPIHVTSVTATTPCCSKVEEFTQTILPNQVGYIKVSMRIGPITARRAVQFLVSTDSLLLRSKVLTLSVDTQAPWEVKGLDSVSHKVLAGQQSALKGSVIVRCAAEEKLDAPIEVDGIAPIKVSFNGDESIQRNSSGIKEWRRDFNVYLPGLLATGKQTSILAFKFSTGRTVDYEIHWEVVPSLSVSPSGMIFTPDSITRTIAVNAADRPFRILKITSESHFVAEPAETELAMSHTIQIRCVNPPKATTTSTLVIKTDRIDQPELRASLLFFRPSEGPSQ